MPNWCENELTVTIHQNGDFGDLDKFKKDIRSEIIEFDFKKIKPYYGEWSRSWCIANWGTKWQPTVFTFDNQFSTSVIISFDTAWTPPIPLVKTLSKQHPNLKFDLTYKEKGMGFEGRFVIKNSIVKCNNSTWIE